MAHGAEEHAVLGLAQRRAEALATKDWRLVADQLHPLFVYVTANGQRLSRAEYLAFLAEGPLSWLRQSLTDVEVVATAPVAVLTATVHDHVDLSGETAHWTFVTTQTYVESDGTWRYLARHTALPTGAS